jgi:hypothetical protein
MTLNLLNIEEHPMTKAGYQRGSGVLGSASWWTVLLFTFGEFGQETVSILSAE